MTPRPVVLYNPRSSAGRKPILPLALLSVGRVLDRPWSIVDGNLEDDPVGALEAALGRHASPVLGITAMPGPQVCDAVPILTALKRRRPELPVVLGGYFATQHWRTALSSPLVDYAVQGHGEHVFAELVKALDAGSPVDGIAGLAYKGEGGPVANARAAIPHPGKLPEMPFSAVPVDRYVRPTVLGRRTLGYHSSYGCPFPCNFCAVVSMVNGRYLAESAERVAAVFATYRRQWGVDAVELYDNNFFVSEARCRETADRVRGLGMAWWGEGRIDTLLGFEDATWRAMADAGLKMVFMGAESGQAETLRRMDKGGTLTPEKTLELVERMGAFGVVPELSFVLGSPPDPEADVEGTLAFVRRVKRKNPRTEIVLYLYTPEPVEGELWSEAQTAGFHWPPTLEAWADPAWADVVQRRSEALPWMPPRLRRRVRDFERVLNAWYPTSTDPRLQKGAFRAVLRGAAAWRWRFERYGRPYELAALQRLLRYQRPETSGF